MFTTGCQLQLNICSKFYFHIMLNRNRPTEDGSEELVALCFYLIALQDCQVDLKRAVLQKGKGSDRCH